MQKFFMLSNEPSLSTNPNSFIRKIVYIIRKKEKRSERRYRSDLIEVYTRISYRRETALQVQGALVLAKSGRLEM